MDENFVQQDGIDDNLIQQDIKDANLDQSAKVDEKEKENDVEEVTFPEEVISPEETLLHCARRGQKSVVQELLKSAKEGKLKIDVNWKGKDKGKRGYSALHLAAYFGHRDVVQLLLENDADVNILNNDGDTPLHKAAYTGRESTVMLLLEHNADVNIRNAEDQTPKDVSQNKQIKKVLEAAEAHEFNKIKKEFLNSARMGDVSNIQERLNDSRLSIINCQDEYGNTALHLAAQSGQKEVAVCLLKSGIDSNIKNKNGLRAEELVQSAQMKQLLAVKPVKAFFTVPHRCEGMLLKKSSFLGWKSHWVLLERGVLSYFKNRGDATTGTKRRGMKYLDEARLFISQENPFEFLVDFSDGTEHRLSTDHETYSSKQMERQKWTNAFREHIEYSTHYIHKGDVIDDEKEDIVSLLTLQESLKVAEAHQTTLANQIKLLSQMIDNPISQEDPKPDMLAKIQLELHHMSAASKDMCTSLNQCLTLFVQQEEAKFTSRGRPNAHLEEGQVHISRMTKCTSGERQSVNLAKGQVYIWRKTKCKFEGRPSVHL
ncbi:hypothetical protein ACJMK2_003550 [Sinanodonta woodiana]|uniref:PH domain-containing protein n=1 Tax=Sinanodonta woodiana TaxID=1069815 RepID=A0ABD3Y0V3_SINWO